MVNHKLMHLQDVEVYLIIPAIRRELSRHMKRAGLEQKEIAKRLGVTDAAISQYINEKRGQNDVVFPESMAPEFEKAVKAIKDESTMRIEIQRLLKLVLDNQVTCKVHKKVSQDVPQDCLVCFENQVAPNVRVGP